MNAERHEIGKLIQRGEIQVGLFRVPVSNYDRRVFREAFINALVYRDFSTLGAVHVKIDDDGLNISSPGGFIDGVNFDNLLVAPPRSRNPLLDDIIKQIDEQKGAIYERA